MPLSTNNSAALSGSHSGGSSFSFVLQHSHRHIVFTRCCGASLDYRNSLLLSLFLFGGGGRSEEAPCSHDGFTCPGIPRYAGLT